VQVRSFYNVQLYWGIISFHNGVLMGQHHVTSLDLVTPQYAYVLGASFHVPVLENANRDYVIVHFQKWLQSPRGRQEWDMLVKWTEPIKVFELVQDAANAVYGRYEVQGKILKDVFRHISGSV